MELHDLDAFLGAAGQESPLCNLCSEPVKPGDARWKKTCQHYICGKRWDLAGKACRTGKNPDAIRGFESLKEKRGRKSEAAIDEDDAAEDDEEEAKAELRKRIVTQYGDTLSPKELREILVQIYRKRETKRNDAHEQMDELAFKAHMKYKRGWKKDDIKAKWKEIEASPRRFNAVEKDGRLLVWVPLNPRIAVEDIFGTKLSDDKRKISVEHDVGKELLFGAKGGVGVPKNAVGVLGGPRNVAVANSFFDSPHQEEQAPWRKSRRRDKSDKKDKQKRKRTKQSSTSSSTSDSTTVPTIAMRKGSDLMIEILGALLHLRGHCLMQAFLQDRNEQKMWSLFIHPILQAKWVGISLARSPLSRLCLKALKSRHHKRDPVAVLVQLPP